jgi:hypothetical protein
MKVPEYIKEFENDVPDFKGAQIFDISESLKQFDPLSTPPKSNCQTFHPPKQLRMMNFSGDAFGQPIMLPQPETFISLSKNQFSKQSFQKSDLSVLFQRSSSENSFCDSSSNGIQSIHSCSPLNSPLNTADLLEFGSYLQEPIRSVSFSSSDPISLFLSVNNNNPPPTPSSANSKISPLLGPPLKISPFDCFKLCNS